MKPNFYEGMTSYLRLSVCTFFILLCVSNTLHATPPVAPIIPVAYITEEWGNSRYIDNGDDTITDKRTLLMWKQCSEGITTDPSNLGGACNSGTPILLYEWSVALAHAENHSFEGYNDWRLPNIKELQSLAAYNRSEPTINETLFPVTSFDHYWTNTIGSNNNEAWILDFSDGKSGVINRNPSGVAYIRLVRDAL